MIICLGQNRSDITSNRYLIGMKTFPINVLKSSASRFALSIACGIIFAACKPVTSIDVSGIYTRATNGVVDTISLATNGTFKQTITFTNGQQWSETGSWNFGGQTVEFDKFYSAFQVPDFKYNAAVVIPPKPLAMQVLWVERGRLLKSHEEPVWVKQ
jgi:hypothetical protein